MARKKMYYSSAKAISELGYSARPARLAIEDAVAWFRANGMLRK
jgi:dihydroflavonol-4-reductase